MVARIVAFRTRAQLGMRPPKSVSRNISPELGGGVAHWGGPAQRIAEHAQCEETWRDWQSFHMDERGWADIAYTMAFCNHGYVLAGRGYGIRTAAQGTNDGNQRYYAYVWIGGQGQVPTQLALDALDWCIAEGRRVGGAGRDVRPHTAFTGSTCPGPDLTRHSNTRHLNDVPTQPEEDEEEMKRGDSGPAVKLLQHCYNNWCTVTKRPESAKIAADGDFGEKTEGAIKTYQAAAKIAQTGRAEGVTTALLLRYERI